MPAWLAMTTHDPTPAVASEEPDTEQTPDGVALKLTGNPELAVAERVIGGAPSVTDVGAVKVMVWDALLTIRVCETGVAAAYVVLPAWLAVTAQDPAPAIASEDPDTEQTPGGVALKLTGRPELAVAERAIGDTPNVTDAGAVKLML